MIKALIFDFGNVLFDLDIEGCVQRLVDICDMNREEFRIAFTPILQRYEMGQIGDENMVWHFQQYNPKINPRKIVEAWNSMLIGIEPDVLSMLDKLKKEYQLYLLSNINGFHARYIDRYLIKELDEPEFLNKYFDQVFYSHQIGMRKPQRQIYTYVSKIIHLEDLSQALFIDDNRENIEAAKAYGWSVVLHDPSTKIADMIDGYIKSIGL